MLFTSFNLASFAFASLSLAIPTVRYDYRLHEERLYAPATWNHVRRAEAEQLVPVRISVRQRNLEEGTRILDDISNLHSPNYGKWWSPEQVRDFFAPDESDMKQVRAWLTSAGVDESRIGISANKQWIQFDAPIGELESLVQTNYNVYAHADGRHVISCDRYSVPISLSEVIDYITPGVNLDKVGLRRHSTKTKHARSKSDQRHDGKIDLSRRDGDSNGMRSCAAAVTTECIFSMYNITKGSSAYSGNELGIFETRAEYYSQADLDEFFKVLAPFIPEGTHPTEDAVDGAPGPVPANEAGDEADLDIQVSYPIIWPSKMVLLQNNDANYENFYYNFDGLFDPTLDAIDGSYCNFTAFGVSNNNTNDPVYPDPNGFDHPEQCGVYKPTNVMSFSYGIPEISLSTNYQRRQCEEYKKLGMQGVSLVFASGDSGVDCSDDDENLFLPQFPVTCPYVTAVGATTIAPGNTIHDTQVPSTDFGSGGGFSNIFLQPEYQKKIVQQYLSEHPPSVPSYQTLYNASVSSNGSYNSIGRAYPDLAAIGQNVLTYNSAQAILADGTSAAAPIFAAILTRINEARLQKGLSTVGFINPTIYAHPELFTDVTTGNNNNDCGTGGFNATVGWDPVSGWGTPRFQAMLDFWTSNSTY